jgi:lycopene cyclase domain-containing protein
MTYTWTALGAVVLVLVVDLAVLRTALVRRRAFWTSYAILLFFQLLVNGLLTGLRVVRYDPARILGPRLAFAPIEDLLFGFALVTLTLSLWVWAARRAGAGPGEPPTNTAPQPARPPRAGASRPARGS